MLRAEGIGEATLLARVGVLEASARRVPISTLQRLVGDVVACSGDPALGLRAAMYTELGDFEALAWVAMSAETWRAAMTTACRYARLLNDAAGYRFEVCGDRTHLILGSTVALEPAVADYQLAAYHLAAQLRMPEPPPDFEVWIKHAAPADVAPYRAAFKGAQLVFGAAFDGFVSEARRLDDPLPTAKASLHRVLRVHVDRLLSELPAGDGIVERVSADILATMGKAEHTATRAATRLGMARPSLTRQLAEHGTSFSELLQRARYRTAMHYLRNTRLNVEDIAFLLGFSDCPPFVRAFKRWSGSSPLSYRRSTLNL
jgi:AraC-like DNA-binding protein